MQSGRLEEAEAVLRRNLNSWEKRGNPDPSNFNYTSKQALTLENLAYVVREAWSQAGGGTGLPPRCGLAADADQELPQHTASHQQIANLLGRLAASASDRRDFAEARRLQEQALANRRAALALPPRRRISVIDTPACAGSRCNPDPPGGTRDATKAIAEFVAFSPTSGPEYVRAGLASAHCVPLATADARLSDARRTSRPGRTRSGPSSCCERPASGDKRTTVP